MALTKQYYLHGLYLNEATYIPVVSDLTPAANVEYLTEYAGAAVTPSFRGGQSAIPDVTFTTSEIKAILDLCTDGDGVSIADFNASQADLLYRRGDNYGSRDAIGDGTALVVRARKPAMVWTRIEARQGQDGTIQVRLIPTWDGTNDPLVGVGSQSIGANLNVGVKFTLGPVSINGSGVDGVSGWTLEQGLDLNIKAADGEIFPRFVGLRRSDPVLTVDTPDLDLWETYKVMGTQMTALIAYLRKRAADTVANVANATAEHIKFTATDNPCGMVTCEQSSGGVTDEASLSLRCALRRSVVGTTHPLTVSTAAAIA